MSNGHSLYTKNFLLIPSKKNFYFSPLLIQKFSLFFFPIEDAKKKLRRCGITFLFDAVPRQRRRADGSLNKWSAMRCVGLDALYFLKWKEQNGRLFLCENWFGSNGEGGLDQCAWADGFLLECMGD